MGKGWGGEVFFFLSWKRFQKKTKETFWGRGGGGGGD